MTQSTKPQLDGDLIAIYTFVCPFCKETNGLEEEPTKGDIIECFKCGQESEVTL